MRRLSNAVTLIVLLWGMSQLPVLAKAAYVGASRCRACHLAQFKSWEVTRMARSFALLQPGVAAEAKRAHNLDPNKDYTSDRNCIYCHVTGYGEQGGFVSLAKTPNLVGVQCEACHGPGSDYLKPQFMSLQNREYKRRDLVAAGMIVPSAEVCKKCHNPKSPFYRDFDYETRKRQGTHTHVPLKYKHD